MLHPAYFGLQVAASATRQTVCLASSRAVFFFNSLNPLVLKQSAQSAIEGARTEHYASVTHLLYVFEDGISVPRLVRKT
jgi:hypothetical protein